MEWVSSMTDEEFAAWLRSVPRSMSQEDVDRAVAARDREQGRYVPHGGAVHHVEGESAH